MSMTNIETQTSQTKEHKLSTHAVYVALIKEQPKASEAAHKAAFVALLEDDDYRDYRRVALERIASMDYGSALQSAFPPTRKEIQRKLTNRQAQKTQSAELTERAMEIVQGNILDFVCPNKKTIRANKFAYIATLGGMFTKMGKLGKPNQIVGDVLSEVQVRKLFK